MPSAKVAGTFGQELPGIPADRMIAAGVKKRIIFMNENDDVRANVGCQNGSDQTVRVFIELFNAEGESLETRTMDLAPWSNNQITRVFQRPRPGLGRLRRRLDQRRGGHDLLLRLGARQRDLRPDHRPPAVTFG